MSDPHEARRRRVDPEGNDLHPLGDNPVDSVDNIGWGESQKDASHAQDDPDRATGTDRSSVTPGEGIHPESASANDRGARREQGRDLAHDALEAAKRKAAARGTEPGVRSSGRRRTGGRDGRALGRRWSGSGADDRDPQPLGRIVSQLSKQRGWQAQLASGQVFGQWADVVGAEIAEHAYPVAMKDGELTVQASSTAWATQLRLLQGQLLGKISAAVGRGVVKRLRIQGPTAPSWRYGHRHVPGRGPRDTYG